MGKKGDLSNFERGMVVGARRASLSISQSAQLLGFLRTTISRVYKELCEKGKTSSMRQSCGRKYLVDARGQRRMGRLIQADRRATLTEITTRYNRGMQQSICEATTCTTLRRMGYNSRRPHRVPQIKFMHLADAFIQSDLQCIQAINFYLSCVPGESNPQPCAS
uniref:Transposase Tc1-like domain-containing protein n=1 Tax=Cyprinus carpio carpio TaxID=630221 RepID=A0A9J8AX61_CYPCA